MAGPFDRDSKWSAIRGPWDILIVGGGITGAGILNEACRDGLRALLVERRDFGSGTSSRSSKLVHGGLRYLKNGQVKMLYESVHEREKLLHESKGLVKPLGFLLANYQGDSMPGWVFGIGLAFYDALAQSWRHKHFNAQEMLDICPELQSSGLSGGYRYIDAVTDDARLVYLTIQEACFAGAMVRNYTSVIDLLRRRDGRVCGVVLQDQDGASAGRTIEVESRLVVNATGAWADGLRAKVGAMPRIRKLRGSHLVIPWERLPLTRAISVLHPIDNRPVLAIPWEGVVIFGTTDVDHQDALDVEPRISEHEVDYLLTALTKRFSTANLSERDFLATYAGVRPVVNTGKSDPCKESREHVIWYEDGLLTVSGGKLTTYRLMARQALQAAYRQSDLAVNRGADLLKKTSISDQFLPRNDHLSREAWLRLVARYGVVAQEFVDSAQPDELEIIPGSESCWAELRWAARSEQVVHLDDLLLRRLRLGVVLPGGGKQLMEQIRRIAQPELGWDDRRWELEISEYQKLWNTCYHCL